MKHQLLRVAAGALTFAAMFAVTARIIATSPLHLFSLVMLAAVPGGVLLALYRTLQVRREGRRGALSLLGAGLAGVVREWLVVLGISYAMMVVYAF